MVHVANDNSARAPDLTMMQQSKTRTKQKNETNPIPKLLRVAVGANIMYDAGTYMKGSPNQDRGNRRSRNRREPGRLDYFD